MLHKMTGYPKRDMFYACICCKTYVKDIYYINAIFKENVMLLRLSTRMSYDIKFGMYTVVTNLSTNATILLLYPCMHGLLLR